MTPDPIEDPKHFPPTRWSMVDGAKTLSEDHRLIALETFLRAYYEPLKNYLCFQFHLSEDNVRDYLHDFILSHVIRKNLIAQADRSRGKFRTFVIQALNHFMIDAFRKQKASKRNPGQPIESLEQMQEDPMDGMSPSAQSQFDREFACGVVHQALARMQERCEASNREDLWKVFYERVLCETLDGKKPLPLDQLTPLLGLETNAQASNLLSTAKRMFARVFKSVVKDYEPDETAIDREMQELRHILSNV